MVSSNSIAAYNLRIGFVSTRFESTDGVSLESEKWSHIFERLNHQCYYFAGLCDRPENLSFIVPEAHFAHPAIVETYEGAFSNRNRPQKLTRDIRDLADYLKTQLYEFTRKFDIHVLL